MRARCAIERRGRALNLGVMCPASPTHVAPSPRPHLLGSVLLSIASLGPTLAVWAAGSHKLGAISRVWQLLSAPGLLLLALCLLVLSAICLRSGISQLGLRRSLFPAVALAASAMPFALLVPLVFSKMVLGID